MNQYPPPIAELLAISHPVSLGAGAPNASAGDRLHGLDAHSLFAPSKVRDADMARACLAGLWLRFDFLDDSHRISQELHHAEGSFWHAIMHRREGDFSNSKYWWRRVGGAPAERVDPVFALLGEEGKRLGLFSSVTWDPYAFVDRVEHQVTRGGSDAEVLRTLQDREWQLLFDHCYRQALTP
jgi:hypothetical protein